MGQFLAPTTKSEDAPLLSPGMYDAIFDGLDVAMVEGGDYGTGEVRTLPDGTKYNRYRWAFTLLGSNGEPLYEERKDHPKFDEPITADALTSLSMNSASKTKPKTLRYLSAIMSPAEYNAFLDSTGLDADVLKGRKVQVEVIIRDNGWPSITNVLPARAERVGGRPSARLVPDNEADTRPEEMFRA